MFRFNAQLPAILIVIIEHFTIKHKSSQCRVLPVGAMTVFRRFDWPMKVLSFHWPMKVPFECVKGLKLANCREENLFWYSAFPLPRFRACVPLLSSSGPRSERHSAGNNLLHGHDGSIQTSIFCVLLLLLSFWSLISGR